MLSRDILELVLNRHLEEQDLFKLMIREYHNHDLLCLARGTYSICFLSTEHIQHKLNQTVCGLRDDTRKTLMHSVRSSLLMAPRPEFLPDDLYFCSLQRRLF